MNAAMGKKHECGYGDMNMNADMRVENFLNPKLVGSCVSG
jgi:hypothetical protein